MSCIKLYCGIRGLCTATKLTVVKTINYEACPESKDTSRVGR